MIERFNDDDLKTNGLARISLALQKEDECVITVDGKSTYIVMSIEQFKFYRERDLGLAWVENQKDIEDGNYDTDLQKHLDTIKT